MAEFEQKLRRIKNCYNLTAPEYARRYFCELEHKPFDREILRRFACLTREKGIVADLGCGPGETTFYLYECGVRVVGVDLAEEMIREAQILCPELEFQVGDMLNLTFPAASFAGVCAFYAIVHFTVEEVVGVFQQIHNVLMPDGWLLLAFHTGDQIIHLEEFLEVRTEIDFVFFDPDQIITILHENGFKVMETVIRYPYPEVEYPSRRAYILARKK